MFYALPFSIFDHFWWFVGTSANFGQNVHPLCHALPENTPVPAWDTCFWPPKNIKTGCKSRRAHFRPLSQRRYMFLILICRRKVILSHFGHFVIFGTKKSQFWPFLAKSPLATWFLPQKPRTPLPWTRPARDCDRFSKIKIKSPSAEHKITD